MAGKRKVSSNSQNLEKKIKLPENEPIHNELKKEEQIEDYDDVEFDGDPVPPEEAHRLWPHRYTNVNKGNGKATVSKSSTVDESPEEFIQAVEHYTKAKDGLITYSLGDDAHVQSEEGQDSYICKILEMFKAADGTCYFRAQWYYRAKDTAIKNSQAIEGSSGFIDNKRVFFSEIKDDNPLGCLIQKLKIVRLPLDINASDREAATSVCNYYCDMMYLVPYSTFVKFSISNDNVGAGNESDSTYSSELDFEVSSNGNKSDFKDVSQVESKKKKEMTLLDLYSGCGGMSTGLSLGANVANVNLITKWAVDMNQYACESLSYNHPETHVRNESAEDFLSLLRKWAELCDSFILNGKQQEPADSLETEEDDDAEGDDDGVYEVEKILDILYGDPKGTGRPELHFKIKWKNYGAEYDSWEPIECLGGCQDRLKEFVRNGYNSKILPLPGDVDVLCGGPPCQGVSGYNRFRDKTNPFKDSKNKQLLVFMDIIEHLRPKFVLMENVVDILNFSGGILGRFAIGRLVGMNYQTRLGMMAAGSYGLPQFRMRVFLWGACPSENLPQYPLPTYNCVSRRGVPSEFDQCYVSVGKEVDLEESLFLKDAISDLPPVGNNEEQDEMPYDTEPTTEFQKFIRLPKNGNSTNLLLDHLPLRMNNDDYQRVCQIPKQKGANFRNLKGVMVGKGNKVQWDPNIERQYLPSGKPLVPDYAMSYKDGTSKKPFRRLWGDETIPTVTTRAQPHNHALLHPLQDRVLTVRENARLQGFPDYYKLFGPIKERYKQVGNAVAVPVSRALGYALGLAMQGKWNEEPLITLPKKFPNILRADSQAVEEFGLS